MNRLQSELHRLYLCDADSPSSAPIVAPDRVRAMVLELTMPPSWPALAGVWHGVQTDLELPAPAIAVSGTDGLQLWFSLAEPIEIARAQEFLEGLRLRYLPDVDVRRIRLALHARPMPTRHEPSGNWAAFVAPDLVPIFAETPWLDIEPNEDGQAALLSRLLSIKATAFDSALEKLTVVDASVPVAVATAVKAVAPHVTTGGDPKRFLLRVMNDDSVGLALRIEAAKALLPYSHD